MVLAIIVLLILVGILYENIRRQTRQLDKLRTFVGEINHDLLKLTVTLRLEGLPAIARLHTKLDSLDRRLTKSSLSSKIIDELQEEFNDTYTSMNRFYDLIRNDIDNLSERVNKMEDQSLEEDFGKVVLFPYGTAGKKSSSKRRRSGRVVGKNREGP